MQYIAEELPAGSAADPTAGDRKVWAIIAYVMTALTVLLFLFTLVMLRRIKIAVATLKVHHLTRHGYSTLCHAISEGRDQTKACVVKRSRGVANALAMYICLISCPLFLGCAGNKHTDMGFCLRNDSAHPSCSSPSLYLQCMHIDAYCVSIESGNQCPYIVRSAVLRKQPCIWQGQPSHTG